MTGTSERIGLRAAAERAARILDEVERAVVGKRPALELALAALLADGHVLIEDYPGLAKTLIARQDQGTQDQDHPGDPRTRPRRTLRLRPHARTGLRRRHLGHHPLFMIDLVREHFAEHQADQPAREEAFFAGAALDDDELQAAGQEDRERRNAFRLRQAEATNSNLGLGHDLRAGLMDPTPGQLHALKAIICHLLAHHHRDVIAYGAGWTNTQRQQPIGDTGRHEPRQIDTILDAELKRALEDPDPLRGIAHLTASWAAAFVLDPDGITRTKTLGTERMARKLADALPGGSNPLRAAVWDFLRPMLSPRLATLHRDTFVFDQPLETTVHLAVHRAESDLAELDLGDDTDVAAA